jgi:hypothetical protein
MTENRKTCLLYFHMQYPSGLQFGAVSATYTGRAQLDEEISGGFNTAYYFQSGNKFRANIRI